jgi:hypothetical protein
MNSSSPWALTSCRQPDRGLGRCRSARPLRSSSWPGSLLIKILAGADSPGPREMGGGCFAQVIVEARERAASALATLSGVARSCRLPRCRISVRGLFVRPASYQIGTASCRDMKMLAHRSGGGVTLSTTRRAASAQSRSRPGRWTSPCDVDASARARRTAARKCDGGRDERPRRALDRGSPGRAPWVSHVSELDSE